MIHGCTAFIRSSNQIQYNHKESAISYEYTFTDLHTVCTGNEPENPKTCMNPEFKINALQAQRIDQALCLGFMLSNAELYAPLMSRIAVTWSPHPCISPKISSTEKRKKDFPLDFSQKRSFIHQIKFSTTTKESAIFHEYASTDFHTVCTEKEPKNLKNCMSPEFEINALQAR
ncbi:unnamed protein product [Gongylonema pulchrum]|uniref:Uncharacterized protein n=1 Tax=Gongylonema pulchrum TaxID=637853 RepID=A0A183CZF5_9BILA|nr:unnamed protein product [Gongylonema pulchrum]